MGTKGSVLIAGATGFVGKTLVNYLLTEGFEVKVLVRNTQKAKAIFPSIVHVLKWPGENERVLFPGSENCQAVINLVGENIGAQRWTKNYKQKLLESRINSVQQLVRLVNRMKHPPKVFIQASAIGFYGTNTAQPLDESGQKGEGFLAQLTDTWEQSFIDADLKGCRRVILRLGIVLSEAGGFLAQMKKTVQFGLIAYPGVGFQNISWIHLSDLSGIICLVIENSSYTGIVNVVSPHSIRFKDFAQKMKIHTGALFTIPVPAFLFKLILGSEKTREMLLANQEIIPGKLLANNFEYRYKNFDQIFDD